jgi:hypothetical protein
MIVSHSRLKFFISLLLLRLSLDFAYINFVSPLFSYAGMLYEPSLLTSLESYLFLFTYCMIAPARLKNPSDFFFIFTLVFYLLPVGLFFGIAGGSRLGFYTINFGGILICLASILPNITLPSLRLKRSWLAEIVLLFLVLVTVFIALKVGPSNVNFDLSKEYEFRPIISDLLSGFGLPYIIPWMVSVLGPFALAVSLSKRKYSLFIGISLMHVLWFGLTSHKTPMFVPFLVLGIWFLCKKSKDLYRLPAYCAMVVLFLISLYAMFDFGLPASLVVRRLFLVPAMYSYEYFTFFESNHIFWSNSILSELSEYQYSEPFPKVIGENAGTGDYANVGFIPTGFMHANFIGVLLYISMYIFVLKLIDGFSVRASETWVIVVLFIMIINITVTSADLPTVFLTHGLIVALLLGWLYKSSLESSTRVK